MTAMLEVRGVTKRFGGVVAVDHCTFSVAAGSLTGLIGPNGSGKTTLFNVITGYLPSDSGEIRLDGRRIGKPDPTWLYRQGVARTFQNARIFPELTLRENLALAIPAGWRMLLNIAITRADRERIDEVLEIFGLSQLADHRAGELSYGQSRLLEFATTLMGRPRLVLLDEPTAGVNPIMIEILENHIRRLHETGVTVLLVEHRLEVLMRLCETVIVLDQGALIAEGPPELVRRDPKVLDAYLGA